MFFHTESLWVPGKKHGATMPHFFTSFPAYSSASKAVQTWGNDPFWSQSRDIELPTDQEQTCLQ